MVKGNNHLKRYNSTEVVFLGPLVLLLLLKNILFNF